MRLLVLLFLFTPLYTNAMSLTTTNIKKCNISFTEEQRSVLRLADQIGKEYNLGETLQAIVMKESFVGTRIERTREVSKRDSSYGLTHLRPSTSVYTAFKSNLYAITLEEGKTLLRAAEGDILALHISVYYLLMLQDQSDSWSEMVGRWNAGKWWNHGKGKNYTKAVKSNLRYVQNCFTVTPVVEKTY